jgi:hypothetical protein
MGPRVCVDDVEERKFLTLPGLELRLLGRQPLPSLYKDYAIPAYLLLLFKYWGWSPYWVQSALRPLLAYCTCPG